MRVSEKHFVMFFEVLQSCIKAYWIWLRNCYNPFNRKPPKIIFDKKIFQTFIFPVWGVSVDFIKILVTEKFPVVLYYFVYYFSFHLCENKYWWYSLLFWVAICQRISSDYILKLIIAIKKFTVKRHLPWIFLFSGEFMF